MRDWRETVAPGAPTVKLDIGSRRDQKILCIPGLQLCNTKDTTAHCLLLSCADLKSRLFDISRLLLSNEVKNDYSTSQKQQRSLEVL